MMTNSRYLVRGVPTTCAPIFYPWLWAVLDSAGYEIAITRDKEDAEQIAQALNDMPLAGEQGRKVS
jgi:hypothetical protein